MSEKTTTKPAPTKLDQVLKLLRRQNGATMADLIKATGWQPHSVRGVLAGSLKKKGHSVTSEKIDGVRRYRVTSAA